MSSDTGDPASPSPGVPPVPERSAPLEQAPPPEQAPSFERAPSFEQAAPPIIRSHDEPPPFGTTPIVPGEAPQPLNPWFSIWVMPRATMRQILDTRPGRFVHVLAILGGVVEVMRAHLPNPPFSLELGPMIVLKFILGVVTGLFALYLWSLLLWMTGRWVGGHGGFVGVRAAIAWSNVPLIWSAMLWLPLLSYLGMDAFNFDPETILDEPAGLLLMIPLGLMAVAVGVWWVVIFMKSLGEAHRFSAWHAVGASLIACALFAIPAIMLVVAALSVVGIAGLSALSG